MPKSFNQNSHEYNSHHVETIVRLLVETIRKLNSIKKPTPKTLCNTRGRNCSGSAEISNQNVHTKKRKKTSGKLFTQPSDWNAALFTESSVSSLCIRSNCLFEAFQLLKSHGPQGQLISLSSTWNFEKCLLMFFASYISITKLLRATDIPTKHFESEVFSPISSFLAKRWAFIWNVGLSPRDSEDITVMGLRDLSLEGSISGIPSNSSPSASKTSLSWFRSHSPCILCLCEILSWRKDKRKLKVWQQSGHSRTASFAWTVPVCLIMSSDGNAKEQTLHFRFPLRSEETPSTTPLLCLRLHTRSENEQLGKSLKSLSTKRWLLRTSSAVSDILQTRRVSALSSSIPDLVNICFPSESLLFSAVSLMIRRCSDQRRATILVDLRCLSTKRHLQCLCVYFLCQNIHCCSIQFFLLGCPLAWWSEVWWSLVLIFEGHTLNWENRSFWQKTRVQETCEFFR